LAAMSSAVMTVTLLAISASGVGMRVAVTTIVSGVPSSAALAIAAKAARASGAAVESRVDLRTKFS
jgi:hypothetical protein